MTTDDTWPQAGEMRTLWKGTTEFLDKRHAKGRHLEPQQTLQQHTPAFSQSSDSKRSCHAPSTPNPVASTEHGCRVSHLPIVSHTEDAEEKERRVVLGMSELSNVCSSHHDDPSGATESLDAAADTTNSSSQRRDPMKGCRNLRVKPWTNGTGKGNACQLCGAKSHVGKMV